MNFIGKSRVERNRELIFAELEALVVDFLNYDRNKDRDLPQFVIERMIVTNNITIEEIAQCFGNHLKKWIQ